MSSCFFFFLSLPILSSCIFLKAQHRGRNLDVKSVHLNKPSVTLKIQNLIHNGAGYFLVFQQKMPECHYLYLHSHVNASQRH